MVEDVEAVVKARGLERFVLVGHSMGGVVAVLYAGARPEKVAGLVLVGTPGKAPPERAEKVLASLETDQREQVIDQYWAKLLEGATDETRKVVEVGREKMGSDRSQSFIRAVFEYDPTSALRKYDGPVLAITSPATTSPPRSTRPCPSRAARSPARATGQCSTSPTSSTGCSTSSSAPTAPGSARSRRCGRQRQRESLRGKKS
jgi:pimeloyl-ACP methyl ester carboxylesterase